MAESWNAELKAEVAHLRAENATLRTGCRHIRNILARNSAIEIAVTIEALTAVQAAFALAAKEKAPT